MQITDLISLSDALPFAGHSYSNSSQGSIAETFAKHVFCCIDTCMQDKTAVMLCMGRNVVMSYVCTAAVMLQACGQPVSAAISYYR